MKKLMIRYRYTFALFYNTAHLMHDLEKLPGVQQLIFLVIECNNPSANCFDVPIFTTDTFFEKKLTTDHCSEKGNKYCGRAYLRVEVDKINVASRYCLKFDYIGAGNIKATQGKMMKIKTPTDGYKSKAISLKPKMKNNVYRPLVVTINLYQRDSHSMTVKNIKIANGNCDVSNESIQ